MKQKFLAFLAVALCTGVLFTACKKSDSSDNPSTSNAEIATQSDDQSMLSGEMENATADVSSIIEADVTFSGNYSVLTNIVCDATIEVNKDTDPMTMTVTYNGASCTAGRTRTGVIVVSMAKGTEWKNAGASVTVVYKNFKVTRTRDNKSVVVNGNHVYTNVSGKLLADLASSAPIVHTVTSSNMSISFDNGAARTWNIARKHTYTYDNGAVLAITGIHVEADNNSIADWGMNRFNNAFTTTIDTALVIRQSCNFRITSGAVTHTTAAYTATATFGLDATGAVATGCPADDSTFYYLLDCTTRQGAHLSIVLPY